MAKKLKWIQSLGGPLLLLPFEILMQWRGCEEPDDEEASEEEANPAEPIAADFRWQGPGSAATDYDRACDVVNDVEAITIGPGHGLLFNSGAKHSAALYQVSSDSAIVIERVMGRAKGLKKELPLLRREQFAPSELFLDFQDGKIFLTDSTSDGERLEEYGDYASLELAPGRYSLGTMDYVGKGSDQIVLHWLEREGPSGQTCAAEARVAATPTDNIVAAKPDEPLFQVQVGGKLGFINRRGELVIEPKFKHVGDFSEGRATVLQQGKYGYIDTRGEIVIAPTYASVGGFCDGVALVSSEQFIVNNTFHFINRHGIQAFAYPYSFGRSFADGRAPVALQINETPDDKNDPIYHWGYIDPTGKLVIECRYLSASNFFNGYAEIRDGAKEFIIDRNGSIQFEIEPGRRGARVSEGLLSFSTDDEKKRRKRSAGFVDLTGKTVIGPNFEWLIAGEFSHGLAWVLTSDERYGYIDRTGQMVIEPKLREASCFSEGLAAVGKSKSKLGYIDTSGEFVIPPQFSEAWDFQDGLARVRISGKWGYIDRTGKMIWEPSK